ncbi:galactocerebrosidase-like [Tubulanus polymorphus]|uniref:galactocerebrosidase-like n=1 Tax=Tubulanus polymorphus TaxID=672921 RepID=UPI003DA4D3FA
MSPPAGPVPINLNLPSTRSLVETIVVVKMAASVTGLSVFWLKSFIFCIYIGTIGCSTVAILDDSQLNRQFDGIGGISGGGATSKLLVNYPPTQKAEILDYLFKPNFAASLHILKVEIGGDSQSTDGTEASHMHNSWDENYRRGYEWWLMVEAKKRNPDIKLYGLPWAFPGWLAAAGSRSPYSRPSVTASYIVKWVQGAKRVYDLTIDYIGIWNERAFDKTYVEVLRQALNAAGFSHVQLVVADGNFGEVTADCLKDPKFNQSTQIIGVHYPGTLSTPDAQKTGKPLWSSEDYSTFNDNVGAGCWARILNQNYVNGLMTSTISWNLIASYYESLPYKRDGLMTADQPWSGHYDINNPIWVTAHTTQFVQIGWRYLLHGQGVDHLKLGGSYVTLVDPKKESVTIVIEKMSHDHSKCIRPALPAYKTAAENVTFTLKGSLVKVKQLNVWMSKLCYSGENCTEKVFAKLSPIVPQNGTFSLYIDVDTIFTLTTLNVGRKGSYGTPPPSHPFPLPYKDTFEGYDLYTEPNNFAPQIGSFEIAMSDVEHGKVVKQTVLQRAIDWCGGNQLYPIAIGGFSKWADVYLQADIQVGVVNGTKEVFIAARVQNGGGCSAYAAKGLFFWIAPDLRQWHLTTDLAHTKFLKVGSLQTVRGQWDTVALRIKGNVAFGVVNGVEAFTMTLPATVPQNGFVAFGASTFGLAYYDNLYVDAAPV